MGIGQWAVIQAFASPMGGRLHPDRPAGRGMEQELAAFARGPADGLIVVVSVVAGMPTRERIAELAAPA